MDAEINCDSDTSESWSLIDVSDAEQLNRIGSTDCHAVGTLANGKSIRIIDPHSDHEKHSQQAEEVAEDALCSVNSLNNSLSSPSEESENNHSFQVLFQGKGFQNSVSVEKYSDSNDSKTNNCKEENLNVDNRFKDFDDTDCISVISESEWNDLKPSAYETDEILDEKISAGNLSNKSNSNALKRKRKRSKLNYRESSEDSVSSDFMFPDGRYYTNNQSTDVKKSNDDMQMSKYGNAPVYRHYRNNVANTVLSLAVGVIFAGVACIALGHFLGVHDAQNTAGEMMDTLKRLQMENILLQTRLAQLSRAFFNRESKLETKLNDENENCVDKYMTQEQRVPEVHDDRVDDQKSTVFTINPTGSIDVGIKPRDTYNRLAKTKFEDLGKADLQTHDNLSFLNISQLDYRDEKSNTLLSKQSAVNEDFDIQFLSLRKNLKSERKKLKPNKLAQDKKFVVSEKAATETENGRWNRIHDSPRKDCLAVREKDLSKFRWFLIQEKKWKKKKRKNRTTERNPLDEDDSAELFYKFPQPKEYYEYPSRGKQESPGDVTDECCEQKAQRCIDCDELKLAKPFNFPDSRNLTKSAEDEGNGGKPDKLNTKGTRKLKKRKTKNANDSDDYSKTEMKNKREKYISKNNSKNNAKKLSKFDGRKKEFLKKNPKSTECKKEDDDCDYEGSKQNIKTTRTGKRQRDEGRDTDVERPEKKHSKKRSKKMRKTEGNLPYRKEKLRSKKLKAYVLRDDDKWLNESKGDDFPCPFVSGLWFQKWANGREKCRADQRIRDWQFDRAKNREEMRGGDLNWQFSRAVGRENFRNDVTKPFKKKRF